MALSQILNASLDSGVYTAKAWVNFNGTGTVAIRASGNVSSITDNGVGDYTINFTTAISDANYATVGSTNSGGNSSVNQVFSVTYVPTTSAVRLATVYGVNNTAYDMYAVNAAVFR
jgi:hypothetical protein